MKQKYEVTKEEFQRFEEVRVSGVVNMLDSRVTKLAGISRDAHVAIIGQYEELMVKFPDVRKGE
jgi:hypothetical protein